MSCRISYPSFSTKTLSVVFDRDFGKTFLGLLGGWGLRCGDIYFDFSRFSSELGEFAIGVGTRIRRLGDVLPFPLVQDPLPVALLLFPPKGLSPPASLIPVSQPLLKPCELEEAVPESSIVLDLDDAHRTLLS